MIELYVNAYQGLNTIKMSSFLPFVYFIALNGDINKSLNSSLKHNYFTEKEKTILHQTLSPILILDNSKLIETIKAERAITQYFIKSTVKVDSDYIIDKKHLPIFKEQWKIHEEKYYLSFIYAIKNGTVEKFIQEKKKKRKSISITTHLKMKLLKLKLKLYHKLSIKIDKQDYTTLSDYRIIKNLIMSTKAIDNRTRDYFKIVNDNQRLLRELKEIK